jgi:hypothetical protein
LDGFANRSSPALAIGGDGAATDGDGTFNANTVSVTVSNAGSQTSIAEMVEDSIPGGGINNDPLGKNALPLDPHFINVNGTSTSEPTTARMATRLGE